MYQLGTEGGGFGPRGLGVPGADDNNKKTYVYDIDHRSNRCLATVKIMDLSAVSARVVEACPVGTGAAVISAAGGEVAGYDMYGQYIVETLGAGVGGLVCYSSIAYGPDDLMWANVFGLPYKHAADSGLPADATYVPPSGLNGRGAFTWGGAFPAEAMLDYTVDRVNMFGDVRDQFATGDRIDDVTMAGTIDNTGAIAITVTQVADSSEHITFTGPAPAFPVTLPNAATTLNAQLSDLWLSKYGKGQWTDKLVDGLIAGVTSNGTNILVDLAGSPAATAQTSVPQPPASDYDDYGPFPMSDQGTFTAHKMLDGTFEIGFNVDADPDHEVRVHPGLLPAMAQLSQASYDVIRAKLIELGGPDIGDKVTSGN